MCVEARVLGRPALLVTALTVISTAYPAESPRALARDVIASLILFHEHVAVRAGLKMTPRPFKKRGRL